MNVLTRYTLKYLWLNKKRTGITILGVILSSALICGVILLGVSFQKMTIDRAISYWGNYHVLFMGVPFEKSKYILENSSVKMGMLQRTRIGLLAGSEQNPERPYLYLDEYDQSSLENMPIQLVSGRLPRKPDELLLSQMLAAESGLDLRPGNKVSVTLGQRSGPGGIALNEDSDVEEGETFTPVETLTYTVVGIMESSLGEQISMFPGFSGVSYLDSSSIAADERVDVAVLADHPTRIYTTAPKIAGAAGISLAGPDNPGEGVSLSYNEDVLQWMGINANDTFQRVFLVMVAFMITLVVAGSGLVIYNAFTISIGERKKQFGMFASTGATSGQIYRTVMFEAIVIGLIGIPLGILGGILGVGITLSYAGEIIGQLVDMDQGMQLVVSPLVIALTVLFTGATVFLSAWIPARRASRVSPIEAIRLSGDIQATPGKPLPAGILIRRLFGFEGELALKSIRRDRKKFTTTVLSLMISIILFVTFNAMKDYITTTAAMNNQAVNFDLVVYLNGENERNTEFVNQVIALPEVLAYSQVRCLYGENLVPREQITGQAYRVLEEVNGLHLENDRQFRQVNLCAFGPSEFERYARSLGLDPQDFVDPQHPSAILMNRAQIRDDKLYEFDFYDISVGESLEVTFTQPGENMQTVDYPVEIGAIAGDLPLGAYQPSWETLLIVSDVVFDSTVERLDPSVMSMGSLFFKASDAQALTGEVKQRYSAIVGESLAYMSVFENNQQEAMMELMVNLFFYGFLTLITLVGVTNIINTIDTNLQLRRREFAMLKSVGLTPRGFRRILNFESLFYGLTSLLCGLPIAILFSIFLYYQLGGISSFSFTLPWRPMLVCTAGVLLIVLTTMLISGARIGKDNIVDTIRAENL